MTTAVVTARPGALTLGRAAAGLALASAVVHLLLVDATSLGALVMAGMALACLPCAWHLRRSPTLTTWGLTAALDAAMLAVHAQMSAGTQHTDHAADASQPLVWLGFALITAQLAVAGAAALRR